MLLPALRTGGRSPKLDTPTRRDSSQRIRQSCALVTAPEASLVIVLAFYRMQILNPLNGLFHWSAHQLRHPTAVLEWIRNLASTPEAPEPRGCVALGRPPG